MKSATHREFDAISARAIHDSEMREILNDLGLHQSSPGDLRAAMDQLDPKQRDTLLQRSGELEERSGRSNGAYLALGDFAHRRWVELMRDLNAQAKVIMADMEPAMQGVRTNDKEAFEYHRTRFAEQGEIMTDAVAEARNQLRRDIRREVKGGALSLDTEARAPLVDHLTRAAPVPQAITDVMGAAGKLEAAKANQDLAMEQRRHLGMNAEPKSGYSM